jgi:hypothetical protein
MPPNLLSLECLQGFLSMISASCPAYKLSSFPKSSSGKLRLKVSKKQDFPNQEDGLSQNRRYIFEKTRPRNLKKI